MEAEAEAEPWTGPIVEEVRSTRERLLEAFGLTLRSSPPICGRNRSPREGGAPRCRRAARSKGLPVSVSEGAHPRCLFATHRPCFRFAHAP